MSRRDRSCPYLPNVHRHQVEIGLGTIDRVKDDIGEGKAKADVWKSWLSGGQDEVGVNNDAVGREQLMRYVDEHIHDTKHVQPLVSRKLAILTAQRDSKIKHALLTVKDCFYVTQRTKILYCVRGFQLDFLGNHSGVHVL